MSNIYCYGKTCKIINTTVTEYKNTGNFLTSIKQQYPTAIIVRESYGDSKLQKILNQIQKDDTLIIYSVHILGKNEEDAIYQYSKLYNDGINIISNSEPHISTSNIKYMTSCMMLMSDTEDIELVIKKLTTEIVKYLIRIAYRQFENREEQMSLNIKKGMKLAQINGKRIGNPKGIKLTTKQSIRCKEIILKYSQDFNGELMDKEVMEICGCARNSYYKYKRELLEK